MRACALVVATVLTAAPAWGQGRQDPERLREQIVQRFMENYRTQAGLTDEQFARLRASVRQHWEHRRAFQEREREVARALETQLRPGVAADQDSVVRLLDVLVQVQAERIEALRAEQTELAAYLSPVQRAQLVLAFARLERQIEQLIQQRMQNAPMPRR